MQASFQFSGRGRSPRDAGDYTSNVRMAEGRYGETAGAARGAGYGGAAGGYGGAAGTAGGYGGNAGTAGGYGGGQSENAVATVASFPTHLANPSARPATCAAQPFNSAQCTNTNTNTNSNPNTNTNPRTNQNPNTNTNTNTGTDTNTNVPNPNDVPFLERLRDDRFRTEGEIRDLYTELSDIAEDENECRQNYAAAWRNNNQYEMTQQRNEYNRLQGLKSDVGDEMRPLLARLQWINDQIQQAMNNQNGYNPQTQWTRWQNTQGQQDDRRRGRDQRRRNRDS